MNLFDRIKREEANRSIITRTYNNLLIDGTVRALQCNGTIRANYVSVPRIVNINPPIVNNINVFGGSSLIMNSHDCGLDFISDSINNQGIIRARNSNGDSTLYFEGTNITCSGKASIAGTLAINGAAMGSNTLAVDGAIKTSTLTLSRASSNFALAVGSGVTIEGGLTLGKSGTSNGILNLCNINNMWYYDNIIQSTEQTESVTYKLPPACPDEDNYVLSSATDGTMAWVNHPNNRTLKYAQVIGVWTTSDPEPNRYRFLRFNDIFSISSVYGFTFYNYLDYDSPLSFETYDDGTKILIHGTAARPVYDGEAVYVYFTGGATPFGIYTASNANPSTGTFAINKAFDAEISAILFAKGANVRANIGTSGKFLIKAYMHAYDGEFIQRTGYFKIRKGGDELPAGVINLISTTPQEMYDGYVRSIVTIVPGDCITCDTILTDSDYIALRHDLIISQLE